MKPRAAATGHGQAPPPPSWTEQSITARLAELGEWFHNLSLGGIQTAPHHSLGDYPSCKWRHFAHAVPSSLAGKSVLDIGCNGGFYALEMKRRGAARVLGIDADESYLAQARFAAEVCGLDIEWRRLSVYDVAQLGEGFDLVLFMGVLYHLRYPLLALDLVAQHVVKDQLLFQTMLRGSPERAATAANYDFEERQQFDAPSWPKLHFVERQYAGDPTNWWIPNKACAEAMLRSSGFEILSNPEEEVYLCSLHAAHTGSRSSTPNGGERAPAAREREAR